MGGMTYAPVKKETTTLFVVTDTNTTPNKVVGIYHSKQFAIEENGLEFEIRKESFSDYGINTLLISEVQLEKI